MDNFVNFFLFTEPNIRYVVLGTIVLMVSSSVLGTFLILQKKSLMGEAIAHSVFPGICLAYILRKENNAIILITGAVIFGFVAIFLMELIPKYSKITTDSAIAIVLSSAFGLGLILISHIQKCNDSSQLGLNNFLLGKAASLISHDMNVFIALGFATFISIFFIYKELIITCFDKQFAITIGINVKLINFILSVLTVLSVVIGIRTVGILLMSSMLITPAYAARFWTNQLNKIILLAAIFSIISSISGAYISYVTPFMPTGPWIVMVATTIAYLSFLFAPKNGLTAKLKFCNKNKEN